MQSKKSSLDRRLRSRESVLTDCSDSDRRGSVLLVVIGLLSLLLLAGIAFYTFASQESSSSEEFSAASKEGRIPTTQADGLFDFALEQLIIGPDSTLVHSALLGGRGTNVGQLPWGRHSLIAGVLGNDITPYNGFGIHLQSDPATGIPYVDQDYNANGVSDVPNLLTTLNFSAAANGGTAAAVPLAPAVDTGVTSPDINSLYLSYTGTGTSGGADIPVHIPSFHRPQYRLGSTWATNPTNWHSDTATATQVFRPHPSHVCANNPGRRRFLSAATTSPSGHLVAPFPFQPSGLNQGVWDLTAAPGGSITQYQYDVDNTGSGVRDGVWMDLDYPVQELADGRRYVPLFSYTVRDADGLINLNVSGNRNGFAPAGALPLANGGNVSRSNMGLSRSEINPEWGLLADPTIDSGLTSTINNEYRVFWNLPSGTYPMASISRLELANRDLFHILHGRASFVTAPGSPLGTPNYRVDGTDFQPRSYYLGRWEDASHVLPNSMVPTYSAGVNFGIVPLPGLPGVDDDGDLMSGRATYDSFLNLTPSMGHPFDPSGVGIGLQVGTTGLRSMRIAGTTSTYLSYYNYQGLSEYFANGATPVGEDSNANGRLDGVEDFNKNGLLDPGEDIDGNNALSWGEDINHNYVLDIEDANGNGTLDSTVSVFPNYTQAAGGTLFTPIAALIDEADESVAEPGLAVDNPATRADMMFNHDEEFGLHASDLDVSSSGFASRLRSLAPANFDTSSLAALIRSQYCVSSFDRVQFTGGSNNARSSWEINYDFDQNGAFEFPPAVFPMPAPLQPFKLDPRDPIRTPLRHLLKSEVGGTASASVVSQLRWNMNQFVSGYTNSGPIYRSLTPHPADPGNAVIPTLATMFGADAKPGRQGVDDDGNGFTDYVSGEPGYVDSDSAFTPGTDLYDYNEVGYSNSDDLQPSSAANQEFWARRDRQQMARDIYVLLYLLGGGNDAVNYTDDNSAPARAIYSNAQLAEMAQFAVNYVDAMDRDNVITKFEYDRNLNNGWSLGDNPFETADDTIVDNAGDTDDRGVVYGVETQELTWSEVLGLITRRVPSGASYADHKATQVNDSDGPYDRFWTYMELRNTSPYGIDLSTGAWQIAVQDDPDGILNSGDETDRTQLTLLGSPSGTTIATGSLFTIGTRGGPPAPDPTIATDNLPSILRVDSTATGSTTPDFTTASALIAPASGTLNLDLLPKTLGAAHNTAYSLLTDGSGSIPGAGVDVGTAGNFLFGGPGGNVSLAQEATNTTFVLRRRAHPYRTMPVSYSSSTTNHVAQSNDNPWIEVDRIVMPNWRPFALQSSSDDETKVRTALELLTSSERPQPFGRTSTAVDPTFTTPAGATPYTYNSVGLKNNNSTLPFSIFQLHFDRDFTAPTDMFSIPLYGPQQLTYRGGLRVKFDESSTTAMMAQERFLRPQNYNNSLTPPGNVNLDNRWYRLLEMMEVPTRTHTAVTAVNSPYHLRTPGRINLNTTRTRGVLAGLLDDWGWVSDGGVGTQLGGAFNGGFVTASYGGMLNDGNRDWWTQFLISRDGTDPRTSMVLPGMAHSRPFRGLNFLDRGTASIDDTVLRSLPADTSSSVTRRGIFEARTSADLGSNLVDESTRHRLLRKVMNNSTTRSNVFLVWVSVGYFEAIQHTNGDVQIGAPLSGAGTHRGFFVIDRSLPEKALNPQTNEFDYQKFIQYRKTIQ